MAATRGPGMHKAGKSRKKGLVHLVPGGKCWLCGGNVDRKLPAPHPASASADHARPLSRGGGHSRRNLRLAHAFCNWQRGSADPVVDDDYRAALRPRLREAVSAYLIKWAMGARP